MKNHAEFYTFSDIHFEHLRLINIANLHIKPDHLLSLIPNKNKRFPVLVSALQSTILYGNNVCAPEIVLLLHPGSIAISVTDWSENRHLFLNIPGLEQVSSQSFIGFLTDQLRSKIQSFKAERTSGSLNPFRLRTIGFKTQIQSLNTIETVLKEEESYGNIVEPQEEIYLAGLYSYNQQNPSFIPVSTTQYNFAEAKTSPLMNVLGLIRMQQGFLIPDVNLGDTRSIVYSTKEIDQTVQIMQERNVPLFSPEFVLSEITNNII